MTTDDQRQAKTLMMVELMTEMLKDREEGDDNSIDNREE